MKIGRRALLTIVMLLAAAAMGFAQSDAHDILITINGVAALELNSAAQISLTTQAPADAGDSVTGTSDSTKRLYYTLLTASPQSIQASITAGAVPGGTSVDLVASNVLAANGAAAAAITLSGTPQDIITGISSTATTRADANVPQLTYTLQIDTPSLLTAGDSQTITVTLTLTGP